MSKSNPFGKKPKMEVIRMETKKVVDNASKIIVNDRVKYEQALLLQKKAHDENEIKLRKAHELKISDFKKVYIATCIFLVLVIIAILSL